MKRSLVRLILALLPLGAWVDVSAQMTAVSSPSGGIQMGGAAVAQGTAVFIPVDSYGHPIAVTFSTGISLPGSVARPVGYSCAISGGAIASCNVPDEVASSPSGFCYNVTVSDTSTGNASSGMSYKFACVRGVTGSGFRLDQYTPTATVPTIAAFTYTTGSGAPTGTCAEPAQYFDKTGHTLYECSGGAWVQVSGSGGSSSPANVFYAQSGDTIASIEAKCSLACTYIVTSPQTITLTSSHALSANVGLDFTAAGLWTVNGSGYTLTITSPMKGALTQHFAGTAAITYAGNQKLVPVEWFGAVGGTTLPATDSTAAVQAAINALAAGVNGVVGNGVQIEYQPLYYNQSGTVSFPSGVGALGSSLGTQIWTTSATADQFHIGGPDHSHLAQGQVFENLALWSTVTRTGTATGFYLNHANSATLRHINIGQNVYDFRLHDSGTASEGGIFDSIAQFYVSDSTTRAGWYLDSEDGICNCSLYLANDGVIVGQNSANATIYGAFIEGSHINDLVTFNFGTSSASAVYINYTGGGEFDSASDLHFVNSVFDTCPTDCIHLKNLPSAGIVGGNVEFNGGYVAATNPGVSALYLDNSSGVSFHDMHWYSASGYGVYCSASHNSMFRGITMMDSGAASIAFLTGCDTMTFADNVFNFSGGNNNTMMYQAGGSDHIAYIGNVFSGGGAATAIGVVSGSAIGTNTNVYTTASGCVASGGTCN